MTDEQKRKLAIGAGAVLVLLLAYSVWANLIRSNPNSADVPNGTFWICKTNGHHFNLTLKQLSDHHAKHYGEPVPCPTCGATATIRAVRCEKCGEYAPLAATQPPCPKCGTVPKPPTPN